MQLYQIEEKENWTKKPPNVQVASFPFAQTRWEVSSGARKGEIAYEKLATISQELNPSMIRSYDVALVLFLITL